MRSKRPSDQDVKHDCGCINKIGGEIVYCSVHDNAFDLLEVAKEFADVCEENIENNDPIWTGFLRRVEKAIAKATGETK